MITKANLKFLKDLSKNNNREWFTEHKKEYEAHLQEVVAVADEVLSLMSKHDKIENESGKKSVMRIYRDVRFSKDKSPYKNHWGGGFQRATKQLRGGYYFHIQPGASFVGGGFWGPVPADLNLIRHAIAADEKGFRKIISSKNFKDFFGELHGDKLKTVPKGFDKEDTALDLLQFKQFLISCEFSDEEVMSKDFPKKINEAFKAMRPFFDWMSYALTHDTNGVPLLNI
ncbi:MAG: DUF2461 domain-containing protein [Bacteroidetes bacterium]|nr:DUF2461 domain-containing protein [Bacteroidota bacterium]